MTVLFGLRVYRSVGRSLLGSKHARCARWLYVTIHMIGYKSSPWTPPAAGRAWSPDAGSFLRLMYLTL